MNIDKLIKINNKIIRIMYKKDLRTNSMDLYKCIDSLPIGDLYMYNMLKFTHTCLYHVEKMPVIFRDKFSSPLSHSSYCMRRPFDRAYIYSKIQFQLWQTNSCIFMWSFLEPFTSKHKRTKKYQHIVERHILSLEN